MICLIWVTDGSFWLLLSVGLGFSGDAAGFEGSSSSSELNVSITGSASTGFGLGFFLVVMFIGIFGSARLKHEMQFEIGENEVTN